MKNIVFLISFLTLGLSCSEKPDSSTKRINLTVLDEKDNSPIGNVQVIFNTWSDKMIATPDTMITGITGHCAFSFDFKTGTNYEIWLKKKGYYNYLKDDIESVNKSMIHINDSTNEDITLYLTSDSMQNSDYWRTKAERYNIDTLINLLNDNKLTIMPLLIWEDIPRLLENSNDTTLLSIFPRNLISSFWQKECYQGVISLWFIESIRKVELTGKYSPTDVYPSLNPIIKQKDGLNDKSDLEKMELASNIYKDWWQTVKNLDKKEACKINPFEDSVLKW